MPLRANFSGRKRVSLLLGQVKGQVELIILVAFWISGFASLEDKREEEREHCWILWILWIRC